MLSTCDHPDHVDHGYLAARVDALEQRLARVADLLWCHVQHYQAERAGLACPLCLAFELASEPAPLPE